MGLLGKFTGFSGSWHMPFLPSLSFLLLTWNADLMAVAPAAILEHETTMKMEAMY